MRHLATVSLLTAAALLGPGCTMPGEVAKGVDPVEGLLVQQLVEESCGEVIYRDASLTEMHRRKITAADVAVIAIEDAPDGGRIAAIRVAGDQAFSYHPRFGMVRCGEVITSDDFYQGYTHSSPLLIKHGGDPALYEKYDAARAKREAQQTRLIDASFRIHVLWEGFSGAIGGSFREIRDGGKGTLAIELPGVFEICTGEYQLTGDNVGTWNVSCPGGITASGTFRSGKGAHGEGIDNKGRKVTYTLDVGG